MINILDLIIGGFILYYLLKNAGGVGKTAKNFLVVFFFLVIFGIITQLLLSWPLANPVHKPINDSYLGKVSLLLIKWTYPAVEGTAPKINSFMKDKIISAPTPEVTAPKMELPIKSMPDIALPSLPASK